MNTPDFSKYSDAELRIAVAKELGWVNIHYGSKGSRGTNDDGPEYWQGISPISKLYEPLPNYPDSLDACREFEKDAGQDYWLQLWKETGAGIMSFRGQQFKIFGNATPRQRCIAFLTMKKGQEK